MTDAQPRLLVVPKGVVSQQAPSDTATIGQQFMQQLRNDHADLTRVLSLLSSDMESVASRPQLVLPLLAEVFAFITTFVDLAHHPREDVLFARLARHSPHHARRLVQLRKSHDRGAVANRELSDRIADARRHLSADRLAGLRRAIERFVEDSREHIGIEEHVFYSSAMQVLDATDWAVIEYDASKLGKRSLNARRRFLLRQARSGGPRQIRGEADGVLEQLGIDGAGLIYGEVFGHAVGTLMLARIQGREAASLAGTALRAFLKLRSPLAYPSVVLETFGVGFKTAVRWTESWHEHFRAGRSIWAEAIGSSPRPPRRAPRGLRLRR